MRFHQAITELNFLVGSVAHAAHRHLVAAAYGVRAQHHLDPARRPSPGTAVYGAAKAALESLTTSLAVEWAPDVRVNAVSCGLVATPGATDHYGDAEQYGAGRRDHPARAARDAAGDRRGLS